MDNIPLLIISTISNKGEQKNNNGDIEWKNAV